MEQHVATIFQKLTRDIEGSIITSSELSTTLLHMDEKLRSQKDIPAGNRRFLDPIFDTICHAIHTRDKGQTSLIITAIGFLALVASLTKLPPTPGEV
ncbi:MAG: hypothetical protein M1834_001040 [Cirrosporium novae-zelandiae]|nr:MAG: hypothetical protein M1834_001040 [Cirrosporium novae-zelandiae]